MQKALRRPFFILALPLRIYGEPCAPCTRRNGDIANPNSARPAESLPNSVHDRALVGTERALPPRRAKYWVGRGEGRSMRLRPPGRALTCQRQRSKRGTRPRNRPEAELQFAPNGSLPHSCFRCIARGRPNRNRARRTGRAGSVEALGQLLPGSLPTGRKSSTPWHNNSGLAENSD